METWCLKERMKRTRMREMWAAAPALRGQQRRITVTQLRAAEDQYLVRRVQVQGESLSMRKRLLLNKLRGKKRKKRLPISPKWSLTQ